MLLDLGMVAEATKSLLELGLDSDVSTGIRREAIRALKLAERPKDEVGERLIELAEDHRVDAEVRSTVYETLKTLVGV